VSIAIMPPERVFAQSFGSASPTIIGSDITRSHTPSLRHERPRLFLQTGLPVQHHRDRWRECLSRCRW
jgi:hypothetical protein